MLLCLWHFAVTKSNILQILRYLSSENICICGAKKIASRNALHGGYNRVISTQWRHLVKTTLLSSKSPILLSLYAHLVNLTSLLTHLKVGTSELFNINKSHKNVQFTRHSHNLSNVRRSYCVKQLKDQV